MDLTQIVQLLTGTPLSMVLLYLLIKTQQELSETRRLADAERREFWQKNAELTLRVVEAVDKIEQPSWVK